MFLIKTIFPQILFSVFLFNCNLTNQIEDKKDTQHQISNSHKIEIVVKQGTGKDEIVCELTNIGEHIYYAAPVISSHNKIILIPENGNRIEHGFMKKVIPVEIQAGESKIWSIFITDMLEHYKLQDEKNLQLIWSVHGVESTPLILNQRN